MIFSEANIGARRYCATPIHGPYILDDDRRENAQLFEQAFYSGKGAETPEPAPDAADAVMLMKLLQNPEMAALIRTLAKAYCDRLGDTVLAVRRIVSAKPLRLPEKS